MVGLFSRPTIDLPQTYHRSSSLPLGVRVIMVGQQVFNANVVKKVVDSIFIYLYKVQTSMVGVWQVLAIDLPSLKPFVDGHLSVVMVGRQVFFRKDLFYADFIELTLQFRNVSKKKNTNRHSFFAFSPLNFKFINSSRKYLSFSIVGIIFLYIRQHSLHVWQHSLHVWQHLLHVWQHLLHICQQTIHVRRHALSIFVIIGSLRIFHVDIKMYDN